METNNNALKINISDSIKESSANLRRELKADMNAIFEQRKKEWSSFKDSVNDKVKDLENKLKANKLESDTHFQALKGKIDDLSLALDKEKN